MAVSHTELGALEFVTHVMVAVFTNIVEVLSMVSITSLEVSAELVRYVYPLRVCTIVCQLSRLVIPSSFIGEPFVS